MNNKKRFGLDSVFSWLVFLHTAAFLIFWLTNRFFYADTNTYLAGMLKRDLDYISLCLWFAALLAGWSAARLLFTGPAGASPSRWQWAGAVIFAAFGSLFIAFFYGSFMLVFQESPVQVTRLAYFVQYFRTFFDILLWVGLVFALRRVISQRPGLRWAAAALLLAAWAVPLLALPGAVYGDLSQKPHLVAHRGAAMLAPENTLAAATAAVQVRTYGLESDVRVGLDGQLFLMHDSTLKRTTNVAEVFPGRAADRAETFTRAELDRLDAGQWFIQTDPFGTFHSGEINPLMQQVLRQQAFPIPAFADWLEVVRSSGQIFIFDLQTPPQDHPFAGQMLDLALAEIQAFGLEDRIWLLLDPDQALAFKESNPKIWRAAGVGSTPQPVAQLVAAGYQIVNAQFDLPLAAVRQYRDAGLWVNLWTVDEPWLYSWLWVNGVDSVTTNNAHTFARLDAPLLAVKAPVYRAVWVVLGIMGLLVALWRNR